MPADKWPVVKLIIAPELLEKIQGALSPYESVQHFITKRIAEHFGVEPNLRTVGRRGTGKRLDDEGAEQ